MKPRKLCGKLVLTKQLKMVLKSHTNWLVDDWALFSLFAASDEGLTIANPRSFVVGELTDLLDPPTPKDASTFLDFSF